MALGRKNGLFVGSDTGGNRAAVRCTIIEAANLNGLDPEADLAGVIGRFADHRASLIEDPLAWRWQPADRRVVAQR